MSQLRIPDEVKSDLDDIWYYIARDNVDAAYRWINKLLDTCESLARNPGMGHTRKDVTDRAILFWPVGEYLILYHVLPDEIEIIAVTQGNRDIPSLLRQRL